MHAVMFRLKRGHLCALANARAFTSKVQPLTPARYDILRVIGAFGNHLGIATQKRVREALALSRTTISKMIRRMMQLGLLDRRRNEHDKRTFDVFLTKEGKKRRRRANHILRTKRPFDRRFARAYGPPAWASYRAVDTFVARLRTMAYHLGDNAFNVYPIHPPYQ